MLTSRTTARRSVRAMKLGRRIIRSMHAQQADHYSILPLPAKCVARTICVGKYMVGHAARSKAPPPQLARSLGARRRMAPATRHAPGLTGPPTHASVARCACKGAAASAAGGAALLALLAAPPVALRLVRLKLPNSWCLFGPVMFAKPVMVGVVVVTPVATLHITTPRAEARCHERAVSDVYNRCHGRRKCVTGWATAALAAERDETQAARKETAVEAALGRCCHTTQWQTHGAGARKEGSCHKMKHINFTRSGRRRGTPAPPSRPGCRHLGT